MLDAQAGHVIRQVSSGKTESIRDLIVFPVSQYGLENVNIAYSRGEIAPLSSVYDIAFLCLEYLSYSLFSMISLICCTTCQISWNVL